MALTHTQIFTHMPVPVLATTHTVLAVVVVVNGLMGLKSCGGCVNVSPASRSRCSYILHMDARLGGLWIAEQPPKQALDSILWL